MRSDLPFEPVDATGPHLTCTFDPPRARVRLHGAFDLSHRDHVADVLECLRLRGCTTVELDALEVTDIDASCLRVLYSEMHHLTRLDGALVLVAASTAFTDAARSVGYPDFSSGPSVPTPRRTVPMTPAHLGSDASAGRVDARRGHPLAGADWTPT